MQVDCVSECAIIDHSSFARNVHTYISQCVLLNMRLLVLNMCQLFIQAVCVSECAIIDYPASSTG